MTLPEELCPYYTPGELAETLAKAIAVRNPRGVLDPAAGHGALLLAVASRFRNARMMAMDVDRAAGMRLRRLLPDATVSICDALSGGGMVRSKVWVLRDHVDVVVANPPFGLLRGPRLLSVQGWNGEVRCGTAAAHLLSAATCFSPSELLALVPDSMLHSERDGCAMRAFESRYSVEVLKAIGSSNFERTEASIKLVRMSRRGKLPRRKGSSNGMQCMGQDIGPVRVVRGGVPMHDVEEAKGEGIPLIHTTNLIGRGAKRIVKPLGRGVVAGNALLLPRVGLPRQRHLEPANLAPHQLSDCVIALLCESHAMACRLSGRLRDNFGELLACWGGTGAQYTTIRKMENYLERSGVYVDAQQMTVGDREPSLDS